MAVPQNFDEAFDRMKELVASFKENEAVYTTVDRQIDNLVYELYELTPEEIAIVERLAQ